MLSKTAVSERRACLLVSLNRATMRYQSHLPEETELTERIKAIAYERRRFGYRRVNQLLRREGIEVNYKKVYRLYREAELAVRKRKHRKGVMVKRQPLLLPETSNHTWSMDFATDFLANGRRIKCLTIVDDFSKECLDIPVGHGISGEEVTRILVNTLWQ